MQTPLNRFPTLSLLRNTTMIRDIANAVRIWISTL